TRLVAPHNVGYLIKYPKTVVARDSSHLPNIMTPQKVRDKLLEYEKQLDENQAQKRERGEPVSDEQEWVRELQKDIKNFETAVGKVTSEPTMAGPGGHHGGPEGTLETQQDTELALALAGVVGSLVVPQGGPTHIGPAQVGLSLKILVESENPVRREIGK